MEGRITILSAILTILAIITVHELGHLIAMRVLGVGVVEFCVGFGPKIFGFSWRGIQFRLRMLPLGGYVRAKTDEDIPGLAQDEVSPTGRALIHLAGPAVNIIMSCLILVILCGSGPRNKPPALTTTWPEAPVRAVLIMQLGVEAMISSTCDLIVGRLGRDAIGGPVMIVEQAAEQARSGLVNYLLYVSFLSLLVGAINLLPIPITDGGQILLAGIEFFMRRPLGEIAQTVWIYCGIAIIGSLALLGIGADILRLLGKQ